MRRFASTLTVLALGFALGLGFASQPAEAEVRTAKPGRDIEGLWTCEGFDFNTDVEVDDPAYECLVQVTDEGGDTYSVAWCNEDGDVMNEGIGLYDPNTDTFVAAYEVNGSVGVAVWGFSDDGDTMVCTGTFERRLGETAHERWSR